MEDRSYRRNRALATPLAHVRGFPANEIECALISMMARSIVKRSTDRSDTLVQDPTSPAERLSPCNTPPVHTTGSKEESLRMSKCGLLCLRDRTLLQTAEHRARGLRLRRSPESHPACMEVG